MRCFVDGRPRESDAVELELHPRAVRMNLSEEYHRLHEAVPQGRDRIRIETLPTQGEHLEMIRQHLPLFARALEGDFRDLFLLLRADVLSGDLPEQQDLQALKKALSERWGAEVLIEVAPRLVLQPGAPCRSVQIRVQRGLPFPALNPQTLRHYLRSSASIFGTFFLSVYPCVSAAKRYFCFVLFVGAAFQGSSGQGCLG